jgi:hypothetical protein
MLQYTHTIKQHRIHNSLTMADAVTDVRCRRCSRRPLPVPIVKLLSATCMIGTTLVIVSHSMYGVQRADTLVAVAKATIIGACAFVTAVVTMAELAPAVYDITHAKNE